jgi:hypothetical protein
MYHSDNGYLMYSVFLKMQTPKLLFLNFFCIFLKKTAQSQI